MNVLGQIEHSILPSATITRYCTSSASVAILEDGVFQTHVFTTGNEDPDTLYRADSSSKSIAAIGIARLVDQGLLAFDDKLINHVDPDTFFHHPESLDMLQHVTIQMLMSHMSGLVKKIACDHTSMPEYSGHSCWHFAHFPGSKWHYDNAFGLIVYAMEKVTGKSYTELMQDLVVEPLRMTRTFWGQLAAEQINFAKAHSGNAAISSTMVYDKVGLAGSGMWTTPSDMLKALSAVQKSLQVSTPFLSRDSARYLLTDGATPRRPGEHVGLGWFMTRTTFGHRGCRAAGYHNYFFGFHDEAPPALQSVSIAIMTNSTDGLEAIRALIKAIMYLKNWPRQAILPSSLEVDKFGLCFAPSDTVIDLRWKEWLGTWSTSSESNWFLIEVEGEAMLQFRSMEPVRLCPAAAPCLRLTDGKTEITLLSDQLGSLGVRLTWSGDERILEVLFHFSSISLRRDTINRSFEGYSLDKG